MKMRLSSRLVVTMIVLVGLGTLMIAQAWGPEGRDRAVPGPGPDRGRGHLRGRVLPELRSAAILALRRAAVHRWRLG